MAGPRAAGRGAGNPGLGNGLSQGLWAPRRYGTRRLQVALRQKGHRVGGQCLRALQPKDYPPAPPTRSTACCAPNRLLDQPAPTQANRVWVSDTTCLPLANGNWAYLCSFQDVASKHVVGWHVMVTAALQQSLLAQPPTPKLLVHSDRGG